MFTLHTPDRDFVLRAETQEDMDVVMTTAELCTYKPIWQPLSDAVTENDFLIDVSKM